jgi:CARDB
VPAESARGGFGFGLRFGERGHRAGELSQFVFGFDLGFGERGHGGSLNYSFTVTNDGSGAAGAFKMGVYISKTQQLGANPSLWVYCAATGMTPGSTFTCRGPNNLPSIVTPGTHYLIAVADVESAVSQSDRNGGVRLADTGPVTIR